MENTTKNLFESVQDRKKLIEEQYNKELQSVYVEQAGRVVQMVSTPASLCAEMVGKLKENCLDLSNKIVLSLNIEFIRELIKNGVNPKNIVFIADNDRKKDFVLKWYKGSGIRVFSGNFLGDLGRTFEDKNMKFDRVVMNPPFLDEMHIQFLQKSLDITKDNGVIACIHPSAWLSNQDCSEKELALKKSIYSTKKEFVLFNGNAIFGIGMYAPCVISYLQKGQELNEVKITNKINGKVDVYADIDCINKFGNIPEYYSVIEKILQVSKNKSVWDNITTDSHYYVSLARVRGNVSLDKGDRMFADDFFTLVPKDLEITTTKDKHYNFGFSTKEQAINFLEYLKTKICRFAFSINKSGSSIRRKQLCTIPWLDFSKEWTDDSLRKEFDITDKEWEFIKSVIPDYY